MNGYVEIKFENSRYGNTYYYMIPDYISVHEIERYVIVEDNFWVKGSNKSPYKIVLVVNKWGKDEKPEDLDFTPTKYIADVIHGERYRDLRLVQEQIQFIDDKMVEKFEELPTSTKVKVMRFLNDSLELIEQDHYIQQHKGV